MLLFRTQIVSAQNKRIELAFGPSIYVNNLNWSIAGNTAGRSPDVLSEIFFNRVVGGQIRAGYAVPKMIVIRMDYNYGITISGSGKDTDYNEDNRTNPIFDEGFLSKQGKYPKVKAYT